MSGSPAVQRTSEIPAINQYTYWYFRDYNSSVALHWRSFGCPRIVTHRTQFLLRVLPVINYIEIIILTHCLAHLYEKHSQRKDSEWSNWHWCVFDMLFCRALDVYRIHIHLSIIVYVGTQIQIQILVRCPNWLLLLFSLYNKICPSDYYADSAFIWLIDYRSSEFLLFLSFVWFLWLTDVGGCALCTNYFNNVIIIINTSEN